MDARQTERFEGAIDCAAAAIFAAAAGLSAFGFGLTVVLIATVAAASYFVSLKILRSIHAGSPDFALQPFEAVALPECAEMDELVLTDADRLNADDELVLDDVLASLGEGSRVVRLFDPSAMPTPGELKARIDRHLDGPDDALLSPDASKALHEALSELRRTLR
jgi:hypothetical protein